MSTATETEPAWITAREVQRRLSLSYTALQGLISTGRVTVRHIPGSHPKFLKSEIDALARRYTKVARPEVEEPARD